MSLELAAQHLASRGRKGDSMLVHMAPEEVSGLQALAKAAGGTLTLNPDTGLPEANFLKRLLPTLIGAGLAMVPGVGPLMAAGLVGGGTALATGNLQKGLMAGLGAYGGAGLTGGLMGAGGANLAAAGGANSANLAGAAVPPIEAFNPSNLTASAGEKMLAGVQGLGTEAGRSAAMSSMGGGMGAAKYGLAALSPMMQEGPQMPFAGSGPNPYEYSYDPVTQRYTRVAPGSRQRDMLAPTTPMMAAGGPIEEMSDRNQMETMMANGGQMFAAGGQVNLQGTFTAGDQGGGGQFGQANANGYQAAGSGGPIQGFSSSFGQMGGGKSNQLFSGGFGTPGGIDPRAVQADPQGFQRWMQGAQQQGQQMPGSTMMGRPQGGYNPSAGGQNDMSNIFHVLRPQGGSLQQLAAQMTPEQRAANQRQMESLTGYGPNGFNHRGSNQMMLRNAEYRPERDDAIIATNNANRNSPAESYGSYAAGGGPRPQGGAPQQPADAFLAAHVMPQQYNASSEIIDSLLAMHGTGSFAAGGMASMARGGPSHLGDYSDGGRLLKGPGDGVSDSIPATIANKRPARLADGEFVVPARIVSELGNGSTEAGARKLYAMMDRVQKARGKTTGKNRVAVNSRAEKLLPA